MSAISVEDEDGETQGLDACPGPAASLECDLNSVTYTLRSPLIHFKVRIILPLTYLGIPGVIQPEGRWHAHTLPHGSLYRGEHLPSIMLMRKTGTGRLCHLPRCQVLEVKEPRLESRCWVPEHFIPSGCSSETLGARQILVALHGSQPCRGEVVCVTQ